VQQKRNKTGPKSDDKPKILLQNDVYGVQNAANCLYRAALE